MPRFVHIADEKNAKKIQKNGIKISKGRSGIFCMPVTNDFSISHQWLRELKRNGAKTLVGVYFKIKSDEKIWFGKYSENHQFEEVGKALKEFKNIEDKLGFEFLIEKKIEPNEITKIKYLPQNVGWRYSPTSHERKLNCGCPICISYGGIKSKKKREKFEPPIIKKTFNEIVEALKTETNDSEIENLFWQLRKKKRKANPEELRFIFEKRDKEMIRNLAFSLSIFQHPNTIDMLLDLCRFEDLETKENSVESIFELKKDEAFEILTEFKNDKIIQKILKEKEN